MLRELIDEEIVQQRAAKMNLTATNEEVDAKLALMKAPYSEEQFAQKLQESKNTLDESEAQSPPQPDASTSC